MNGSIVDQNNLTDISKDILTHPEEDMIYLEKLMNEFDFTEADMNDLSRTFSQIKQDPTLEEDKKRALVFDSWKLIYRTKPPTIKEFLNDPQYLGSVSESIYPHIKDWVENFFDFSKPYRNLILASSIGAGKSFATSLATMYEIYILYHCRDVKKLLGQSSATNLAIVFISFTENKVKEVLAEILMNMMNSSPKFKRCQTLEQMNKKKKNDSSTIYFSTAGSTNFITCGDLNLKVTSSMSRLLGLNTPMINLSEMNWYSSANKSPEEALNVYQKAIDRVYSRLHRHPLGRTILDSSPYDRTLPIENYVWNELRKNPDKYPNYKIITGSQWEFDKFKPEYPLYDKKGLTFPAFIGSGSKDPCLINPMNKDDYHVDEIIDIPEDLRQQAETRLIETIRDFGGIPMGGDDVLIRNNSILENIFNDNLRNLYTQITAPSDLNPEGLIWNQIKDTFFFKASKNKYEFYRNPKAPRFLSFDLSYSGDTTGIAMSHVELNDKGELIYITDFTIPITPKKSRINLDAIKLFIHDLRRYGNIDIHTISFDKFVSEPTIQYLKRHDFNVITQSVDSTMSAYLNYVSLMEQGRVKMGKNLLMKNNLKSLRITETPKAKKKKIDHLIGKVKEEQISEDWNTSRLGYYAKDVSDAVIASVNLAVTYGSKNPRYLYSDKEEITPQVNKNKMKEKIKSLYGLS